MTLSQVSFHYKASNRRYWKLPEGLPINNETVRKHFELQNQSWNYFTYFSSGSKMLYITLTCESSCAASFDVKFGISGDYKTIFVSKAISRTSPFISLNLISRSSLDLLKLENKPLYFFIEMKAEEEGKASKREEEEKASKIEEGGKASKREEEGKERKRKANKRKLKKDFEDLLLNGIHSDITIEVKDKKFKCHRGILCVRSPVFSAMLEHDMKEKVSGIITVEDAEPTPFQDFLVYLYTGSSDSLNWKNMTDLYKLGDKYSVEDFKSLCVAQMKNNISTKNFCEVFLLSQHCYDSELADISIQFFLKEWEGIIDSENWLILLSEHPVESTVLIKALARNDKSKSP